jgi:transcriptional regulator with GAF, ATPase, and Fis domain
MSFIIFRIRHPPMTDPFQTLLGVAESVTTHPDPTALVRDVAARLREAVHFHLLGVVLHDPVSGVMRLTIFASDDPSLAYSGANVTPMESPSGQVWKTQEPVLIPDLSAVAEQYPAMRSTWEQFGMRSAYYVPLTTPHRKLGTIFFARCDPHAHGPDELALFRFAAAQAAVAIDNALAAADVSRLRDELRDERDRLRLLLDVLIERCVLLSPGPVLRIPINELTAATDSSPPETSEAAPRTLEEAEREHIIAALKDSGGKVGGPNGAAARLGMKRTTLQSRIKKLGIRGVSFVLHKKSCVSKSRE